MNLEDKEYNPLSLIIIIIFFVVALSLTARATNVVFVDLGKCLKRTNYKEVGITEQADLVVKTPQEYIKILKGSWGIVTKDVWDNVKSKYKCKDNK